MQGLPPECRGFGAQNKNSLAEDRNIFRSKRPGLFMLAFKQRAGIAPPTHALVPISPPRACVAPPCQYVVVIKPSSTRSWTVLKGFYIPHWCGQVYKVAVGVFSGGFVLSKRIAGHVGLKTDDGFYPVLHAGIIEPTAPNMPPWS